MNDFNHGILHEVAHRPWPLPHGPWLMMQTWRDLLFAHWPVPVSSLAGSVPAGLELDLFDGQAWIGIVPFVMTNVAPRGVPALPGVSTFPELNVRTYVRRVRGPGSACRAEAPTARRRASSSAPADPADTSHPGVLFFSLDAGSALAVHAARLLLNLPYFRASMEVSTDAGRVHYRSRRLAGRAELVATYGPTGAPSVPLAGSLEYFLTERYCLYATHRTGRPYRLDIHHPRWPLQPADAEIARNTMAAAAGVSLPEVRPLLHFARRQDMVAWAPRALRVRESRE